MTFETKINDRIKAARKEGVAYGEAIGEAIGEARGRVESLISLVKKGLISAETAANESGLTVEEFMQKMNPASACEDTAQLEQE